MRQGGMKPKSHSSGTYWIRANANTGGNGTKNETKHEITTGACLFIITIFSTILLVILASIDKLFF